MNMAVKSISYEQRFEVKPVPESELTFKDKIYLSLLMNTATTEDVMMIGPTNSDGFIAPTKAYLTAIFKHLVTRNILITQLNYEPRKRGQKRRAHIPDVYTNWHKINVAPNEDIPSFVERMRFLDLKSTENYLDKAYDMWLEISAYELIAMVELEAATFDLKLPSLQWAVDETFKSFVAEYSLAQLRTVVMRYIHICMERHLSGEFNLRELSNYITNDFPYYLQKLHHTGEMPNITKREQFGIGSSFLHTLFFNGVCGFTDSIYTLKPSKSVLDILK